MKRLVTSVVLAATMVGGMSACEADNRRDAQRQLEYQNKLDRIAQQAGERLALMALRQGEQDRRGGLHTLAARLIASDQLDVGGHRALTASFDKDHTKEGIVTITFRGKKIDPEQVLDMNVYQRQCAAKSDGSKICNDIYTELSRLTNGHWYFNKSGVAGGTKGDQQSSDQLPPMSQLIEVNGETQESPYSNQDVENALTVVRTLTTDSQYALNQS